MPLNKETKPIKLQSEVGLKSWISIPWSKPLMQIRWIGLTVDQVKQKYFMYK